MTRRGRHARVHSGALPACAHRARPRGGGRGEHRWPMGAGGTAQRRRRGGKRLPKGSRAANEREGEGCRDCRAGHTSHTHDRDRDGHARGDRDNFSCAGANRHVHVQPARQHTAGVRACPADEVVAPRPEGVDCRERSLCTRRPVRVNWYPVSSLVYPPLSLFRQTHTPPDSPQSAHRGFSLRWRYGFTTTTTTHEKPRCGLCLVSSCVCLCVFVFVRSRRSASCLECVPSHCVCAVLAPLRRVSGDR